MTDSHPLDRVLVAGASGATGEELLSVLRPTDLTVRATTRSYGNVDTLERHGADEVIVADFFDSGDAVAAVEDCDLVCCALGTPPGLRHTIGTKLVDRTGVINLITAAVAADVSYFVFQSAIGVGDSKAGLSLPARLLLRSSLRAKRDAETTLRRSGLGYTIVRPGRLTDDPPSGDVVVGQGGDSVTGSIPRADVARIMAAAPFTPDARNRTFEIVSRDGLSGTPHHRVDVDWADDILTARHGHRHA
ncbi:3-beta hydroxysteroid dehydrogenase/isomerase family protein [Natrinema pellirubrum DSM 15624]|uniref:3-beta hydroxysteroid dehydrogenase/isomerase family protein n=1 Tax=Natrinema pellirubrum (strain DSM 15624 / CIP 106293 / JCM 10476 / NCIMB 786 / 157) TaxID=797303 RepID=L0JQ79_NATP1|nr:SDR family oxidoreductase [Natrinema pellirubrum]AGB32772.1 NmrA-like family protein [Natrinema pellirubrum DSM 15624]ELY75776.1 3-beta hydroxysteroid dehydrogenase/isomerase family protein [Natrinema pellirubrum DSM 15624]